MAKDQSLLGLLKDFTRDEPVEGSGGLSLAPDGDDLLPSADAGKPKPPAVDDPLLGLGADLPGERKPASNDSSAITENREQYFSKRTGRFTDPDTGQFEPGSPPPDLDTSADRYRAKDGRFKSRSKDLFDEPDEVASGSLEPRG